MLDSPSLSLVFPIALLFYMPKQILGVHITHLTHLFVLFLFLHLSSLRLILILAIGLLIQILGLLDVWRSWRGSRNTVGVVVALWQQILNLLLILPLNIGTGAWVFILVSIRSAAVYRLEV